jgi:hypothetical protein
VKNGEQPVAPSAIAIEGQQHFTMEGMKDYETPGVLNTVEEINIVQDYKKPLLMLWQQVLTELNCMQHLAICLISF